MLDAKFFEAMKPGAFFVNTSRGEVVDAAALRKAIGGARDPGRSRRLREGALRGERDLRGRHREDRRRHRDAPRGRLDRAGAERDRRRDRPDRRRVSCRRGDVPNAVNLASRTPATHVLSVRHRDRVGVLAHVFGRPARGRNQRREDGERRLRGRRGGLRAHPGRFGAAGPGCSAEIRGPDARSRARGLTVRAV